MKKLTILIAALTSSVALAQSIGVSTHPFVGTTRAMTTEVNRYTANGTGTGITAKYYQAINEAINIDAGIAVTEGARGNRFFAGADYLLIPDYGRQPRVSAKAMIETMEFDGERINGFGIAPTLSKGFNVSGREVFPFLALPVKINLNEDSNTYKTSTAISAGATAKLNAAGFENIIANLETTFSVRNSYNAIVLGLTLPIQ